MRKSSFHFISGDSPLNQVEESLYRLSYLAEAALSRRSPGAISCQPYVPRLDKERLLDLFGERAINGSPSRILCFDFILERAGCIFGPSKSVVDLGCGTGVYSQHLRRAFGFRDYRGYDIAARPEWAVFAAPDTHFATAVLGEDWIDVDDTDVIFSQSVLEHIQYDRQLFERFRASKPRRLRHLHLIPATRSFFEQRLHGFRRYAPATIAHLLSVAGVSNVEVWSLGSWLSRELHWAALGKPKRCRHHDDSVSVVAYDRSLAVIDNMIRNKAHLVPAVPLDAAFYVLTFDQDVMPKPAA